MGDVYIGPILYLFIVLGLIFFISIGRWMFGQGNEEYSLKAHFFPILKLVVGSVTVLLILIRIAS